MTWLLVLLTACGGCSRKFYRNQADKEVDAVLAEKDKDPRWKIMNYHIYPDPRARFADWTKPDRPPMPPDEKFAKALSPNPQRPRHAGVAYIEGTGYLQMLADWDAENRKAEAERQKQSPIPWDVTDNVRKGIAKKMIGAAGPSVPRIDVMAEYAMQNEMAWPVSQTGLLPTKEAPPKQKPYLITMDQSVELAVINSREFQLKREGLYLTALPVTLERFSFAAQGFAAGTVIRDQLGGPFAPAEPPLGLVGQRNSWAYSTTGGFSKLFSTGALLLMQFANQTVINLGTLSGTTPARVISQSTASLDIVQPFLQGGGKAVTLEPLTQTERNLLYAVRDYAKYRQEFYAYITVGQTAFIAGEQAGVNAISNGTVVAPSAFVPNNTKVAQPLGSLSGPPQVVPGQGGLLQLNQPPGASAYGYMNVLLQKAQLNTYLKNVASFDYFFRLLQVYQEGGIVNPVQVITIEQAYVKGIETMLTNWNQYRQALDLFRIQLGLPTTMPLELSDGPLQLMYDMLDRFEKVSMDFQTTVNSTMEFDKMEEADKLRARFHKVFSSSDLVADTPFRIDGPRRWKTWEALPKPVDIDAKIKTMKNERDKLLDLKADLQLKNQLLSEADTKKIAELSLEIGLGSFEKLMRDYDAQPWKKLAEAKAQRGEQAKRFLQVHRAFMAILSLPMTERMQLASKAWPELPPVYVENIDLLGAADDTALETVVRKAIENRLDLMNQQAQLVDSWRKLAVSANALLGVFNVEYNLNATTNPAGSNPFGFSTGATQHQIIMNWQLPIVRIQERNNYRSTLIAYQQQRRQWMDALDQVAYQVRFQLRNLRFTAYNYHRVQKRAIELAYLNVDQSLQAFNQPLAPSGPSGLGGVGPPPATGGGASADPAALTLQLLNAQNSLVAAQNDLYAQWLGYLQQRISLYRDLGVMPIDDRGIWIENVSYPPSSPQAEQPPTPLPTPRGDLQSGNQPFNASGFDTNALRRDDTPQGTGQGQGAGQGYGVAQRQPPVPERVSPERRSGPLELPQLLPPTIAAPQE